LIGFSLIIIFFFYKSFKELREINNNLLNNENILKYIKENLGNIEKSISENNKKIDEGFEKLDNTLKETIKLD
jgi:peptidoglycan hydrolase CwlO-like protein